MRLLGRRETIAAAVGFALVISGGVAGAAGAAEPRPRVADRTTKITASAPERRYPTENLGVSEVDRSLGQRSLAAAGVTPPVGTVRQWLGQDEYQGSLYRKDYRLRAVGTTAELWVATETSFPAGDCRGTASTLVTDAQAAAMITQFDSVISPRETAAFSTAPSRDGSNALLGPDASGGGGDYTGDGAKTVILVDNIRDDNFYNFPAAVDYRRSFFSGQFNELFDRNVVTLDAFDWTHRTTANPPDAPTGDPCTSRPAVPNLYEAQLARSYYQLLQYYSDPNEVTWVTEGLSGYAEGLTGYADPRKTVLEKGADLRILCFQGFGTVRGQGNPAPAECGGPENSLTTWGESSAALRSDQGQAWSLMVYLRDRFGAALIKNLHLSSEVGLTGLQQALSLTTTRPAVSDVLHDFQAATLLDAVVDRSSGRVQGLDKSRVVAAGLTSTVNVTNPAAYAGAGAPPNGADYVALRSSADRLITGDRLTSLSFTGDATLPSTASPWTSVANDPDRPGNPVLWSGDASNSDAYALTQVSVPTVDPTLRFLGKFGAELGYDYGYVVVSTDGGLTYTAVAGDKTVTGPQGPALNGTTNGFEPFSFDLSAYAGRQVVLGFRYVSDKGVNEGGLLVDDVTLGGSTLSDGSNAAAFRSRTQIRPIPATWFVRLIGIDLANTRALVQSYSGRSVSPSRSTLAAFKNYPLVVAVVSHDQAEGVSATAAYRLTANGVIQPGGGTPAS